MVHFSTKSIRIPGRNSAIHTLSGRVIGSGMGSVILDGGIGGQSSYHGIDDYIETTHRNPFIGTKVRNQPKMTEGQGLADKIQSTLSRLNITKHKRIGGSGAQIRDTVMRLPSGGAFDAPKPFKRKNIVMTM
jgi:hypothetical protein